MGDNGDFNDLQSALSTTEVGGGVSTQFIHDPEAKDKRAVEINSTTNSSTRHGTTSSSPSTSDNTTPASSTVFKDTTSIPDFASIGIEKVKERINEKADVANDYAAEKIVNPRGNSEMERSWLFFVKCLQKLTKTQYKDLPKHPPDIPWAWNTAYKEETLLDSTCPTATSVKKLKRLTRKHSVL